MGAKFKLPGAAKAEADTAAKPKAANKPKAAAKAQTFGAKVAKAKGDDRLPILTVGSYVLKILKIEVPNDNPEATQDFLRVTFEVLDSDGADALPAGTEAIYLEAFTSIGAKAMKRFFMAATGHETPAEYDEFDPEGEFVDACLGAENEYAEQAAAMIGAQIGAVVTKGNVRDDGDYFRKFQWHVSE